MACNDQIMLTNYMPYEEFAYNTHWFPRLFFVGDNMSPTPCNPKLTWLRPYDPKYGFTAIHFEVPNENIDGLPLDRNRMSYSVYVDDELYVFTPELFPALEESMSELPCTFCDHDCIWPGDIDCSVAIFFILPLRHAVCVNRHQELLCRRRGSQA